MLEVIKHKKDFYSEKPKDKIIFKNNFGTIYENKIRINYGKNKTELLINELANFRLIQINDTRINILFFVTSCLFATLSFFIFEKNSYSIISCAFSLLFITLTMFYKKKNYSVQFVLSIAKQIFIEVNKKDKKIANDFVKKLESYKESNPSLMLII